MAGGGAANGSGSGRGAELGPRSVPRAERTAMASRWALRLALLLGTVGGLASGLHSLRYFRIAVTKSSSGVPEFVSVGYVDGSLISRYDSESRRVMPRADWMKANLDQNYWDTQSEIGQGNQEIYRTNLDTLRQRYNQTGGVHTIQVMHGCDLLEDNSTKGYYQVAYDGKDFISLDMEKKKFIAADVGAIDTKIKWEKDDMVADRRKNYVENICIPWLKNYVEYGKEVLERKELPTVRVSGRKSGRFLTLRCRVYGFYPRLISVNWLKDNEVRDQDTMWSSIAPNSDGTFYTAAAIDIHPEEREKYRCRVDHSSLSEPGLYAWDEPPERDANNVVIIAVAVVVAILLFTAAIVGVAVWKFKPGKQKDYVMASSTDTGIGSAGSGSKA